MPSNVAHLLHKAVAAAKGRLDMKHRHHPTNPRLGRSGIARLLLAGLLGLSPLSAHGSDWRGVYGAWGIDPAPLQQGISPLEALGIHLLVMNIGLDESNLD